MNRARAAFAAVAATTLVGVVGLTATNTATGPQPPPLGWMGSNLFGAPLALDDPNTPFLGNYGHYTRNANGSVGVSFRSPYTGQVDSIRTLFGSMNGRDYACYYACGNGGVIRYRLYAADTNGYPTGPPLASDTYARGMVDGKHAQGPGIESYQVLDHPRLFFSSKPAIVAGGYYVVTFENIDPDPTANKSLLNWEDWNDYSAIPQQGPLMDPTALERRAWSTIMSFDGGTSWIPASQWDQNPANRGDPYPLLAFRLTDGSSFGNAYMTQFIDHYGYSGKLGLTGLYGLDVQAGADTRREEFTAPQNFTVDKMAVTLVPYESGPVTFTLRDVTNNAVVRTCTVAVAGEDQGSAYYKANVASRVYACDVVPVELVKGTMYHLEVAAPPGSPAKASIVRLHDGPGWPWKPDGPYKETPNAVFPYGRGLDYCLSGCGDLTNAYDMSFYLRIVSPPTTTPSTTIPPTLPPITTTTRPPATTTRPPSTTVPCLRIKASGGTVTVNGVKYATIDMTVCK